MRKIIDSVIAATILTLLSYGIGVFMGWMDVLNWLEVACVFTSFSCTYLCVMGSRWNFPMGILSVSMLSYFFFTLNLYSSMLLSVYLIPVLVVGWFKWGDSNNVKPVTRTTSKAEWQVYVYGSLLTLVVMTWITDKVGAQLAGYDAFIFLGSILAQYLLTARKIETWFVWAFVNIIAIYTYINSEAYLVGLQYMFFLINTVFGYIMWNKEIKEQETAKCTQ